MSEFDPCLKDNLKTLLEDFIAEEIELDSNEMQNLIERSFSSLELRAEAFKICKSRY